MIEKYEECPNCNNKHVKTWHYDMQTCAQCGYGTAMYNLKKVHPYRLVKEFHLKFNHPIAKEIINLDDPDKKIQKLITLRCNLLYEECMEFSDASAENNEIEMLDALCDMIYVIYGMAIAFGWDINAAFAEVHRSNMSKLDKDGNPIVREDGKILKGENYSPPNLAQFFKREK